MSRSLDPIPQGEAIVEPQSGTITVLFTLFWEKLRAGFQQVPMLASLSRLAQAAAIATTTLWTTRSAGTYRITVYARITQAATTSSSLTITLGWVELSTGAAVTKSFPAMTGNTIGTVETFVVEVPATNASNLTIATSYASVGGTVMLYRVDANVEQKV